jgi:hypothetical protein
VNANIWMTHKKNVDKVMGHSIFENVRGMEPASISNDETQA